MPHLSLSNWLGIALIVIGVFFGFYSYFENKKQSKTIHSQHIKSVKELFEKYIPSLSEKKPHVDVIGRVYADKMMFAPFSHINVAYYQNKCFMINENKKYDKDEEILVYTYSSPTPLYISETRESDEKIYIDVDSFNNTLDLQRKFDSIESASSSYIENNSDLLSKVSQFPNSTKFRLIEKGWASNSPLHILGDLYEKDNKIFIGASEDKDQPTLITVHQSLKVSQANKYRGITIGALSAIIGLLFMIFTK